MGLGWAIVVHPPVGPRPRRTPIPENGDAGGWLRDSGGGRTEQQTDVRHGNRVTYEATIAAACRDGIAVTGRGKRGRLHGRTGPRLRHRQRNQEDQERQYRCGESVDLHRPIFREIAMYSNKKTSGLPIEVRRLCSLAAEDRIGVMDQAFLDALNGDTGGQLSIPPLCLASVMSPRQSGRGAGSAPFYHDLAGARRPSR